jgi:hypothetical protein
MNGRIIDLNDFIAIYSTQQNCSTPLTQAIALICLLVGVLADDMPAPAAVAADASASVSIVSFSSTYAISSAF